MSAAADYWKLKRVHSLLSQESCNLSSAYKQLLSCQRRSAKICFNLAVLALWQQFPREIVVGFLEESLKKDSFLAISAFYLGCLLRDEKWFRVALKGFRNQISFIDYTEIGLPFRLERENVLFNLVALQKMTADPNNLNNLSIQSISSLLLSHFENDSEVVLQWPPIYNPKMIFNLLPKIEPKPLELKGPEHVSLIEGEEDYFSGFPDAHLRLIRMNMLK